MMFTRLTIWAMGLLFSLAMIGWAAPAQAADQINFSTDGSSWSATAPTLFPGVSRIVPGDTITDSFWISNGSANSAFFQILADISLTDPTVSTAPESAQLRLLVEDHTDEGVLLARSEANLGGGCVNIVTRQVPGGGKRKVVTSVSLPWSAGNEMRLQQIRIPVTVRGSALQPHEGNEVCAAGPHVEAPAGTRPDKKPHHRPGKLPQTGAPLSLNQSVILISLSAFLIYLGIMALSVNRREQSEPFSRPHGSIREKIH